MRAIDYHMHTWFSTDSNANPKEHILQAIACGLDEICFTDHQDFHYPYTTFDIDIESYYQTITSLKEEFKNQIIIKWGIEMGLDCNYESEITTMIDSYPFDFVIGSLHVIQNTEFYEPADFFKEKTKQQAHRDFFKETLKCVKTFDCFNVLGHLDYIVRYGPYKDKSIDYVDVQPYIDEILKIIIEKGIGLEVNTSGYALYNDHGFPNFEIMERYYQLGGRIVTIGSDSHTSDRVGQHVFDVIKNYQKIGFKDVATFTNRKIDKPVK